MKVLTLLLVRRTALICMSKSSLWLICKSYLGMIGLQKKVKANAIPVHLIIICCNIESVSTTTTSPATITADTIYNGKTNSWKYLDSIFLNIGLIYSMQFYFTECGGVFTEMQGLFASPNYPSHYPTDIDCEWVIRLIHQFWATHDVEVCMLFMF